MAFLKRVLKLTAVTTATAGAGWYWYTKDTHFIPFTTASPDFTSRVVRKYNPSNNPPICIDHAVRQVPLSQLKTTDQETLTREFCRGIWAGPGYTIQRLYLQRKYRPLEGRQDQLWEPKELEESAYPVGTKITDHFEVVERTPEKVAVRAGSSPLEKGVRPSDGIFSIEVTKDGELATFHLKSIFFDSTPEGKNARSFPPHIDFLHREYAKLWMETSVRRLLK